MSVSIFKPRSNITPVNETGLSTSNNINHELTRNNYYCMSKLPGLPSIFKSQQFLNAYSESFSNYSLVINEQHIYVWQYNSSDHSPLAIQFPIEKFQLPMAILTRPTNGIHNGLQHQDPGLIIIDSISGLIKFYESVQHAPTLGLINDKSLELNINLKKGEGITLAENIEPSGIIIATSHQRCILITLRDFKHKPHLSTTELINNGSGIFDFFNKTGDNEIVAIRSGKKISEIIQEILILDSIGNYHLITFNLISSVIEYKKSFKQTLHIDIDGYPSANNEIKYLDIWPLENYDNVYLALCQINNRDLFLITLKIDKSGVLLYGSHRLKTASAANSNSKPKLYLPKPSTTAFIIIDNSIILTDLNTSYIESQNTSITYYKPRWEDVVRLKSSVEIIGSGYENQTTSQNPSIILITNNFGILKLEKFPEQESISKKDIDPILIVKSHIEQGIFYSSASSEIDFDLSQKFDNNTILQAIELINEEILNSKSSYLPKKISITELTKLKVKLFKELINYILRNFDLSKVIPKIAQSLEKANVALNLWKYIDENNFQSIFEQVQPHYKLFFIEGLSKISVVLNKFIQKIDELNKPVIPLIITTLYHGLYINDIQYQNQNKSSLNWLSTTDILMRVEAIFTREYSNKKQTDDVNAYYVVESLYYFFNKTISCMTETDDLKLDEYAQFYNSHKSNWIDILLNIGYISQAIEISEKYHDFAALAKILDIQRDSNFIDISTYGQYFEEYGYEFASHLYDYYLKYNKIQILILDFTNYKQEYLYRWFEENPKKTSKVSWIRYLLDKVFIEASNSLVLNAEKSRDNLKNQQLKYSMAKLACIAGGDNEIEDLNKELKLIKVQTIIKEKLGINFNVLKQDFYIKNYLNENIKDYKIVESFLHRFIEDYQLTPSELINLISTFRPSLIDNFGELALNVAKLISNENERKFYIKVVFTKLLTIGDNEIITNGTDEMIKESNKKTSLYKALVNHHDLLDFCKLFINNPKLNDNYEIDTTIREFNDVLLKQLQDKFKNDKKFKSWVESIIEQIKFSS
ncbi:unnamed protein product [Candida verbasci]|uniref:Nucleoporin Nup133/Nup155-like N-terminal domain-containing protein n=1 Tax=Candida verbasci TaxID=1227364 RepID=A0A9W4TTB6_9ASCO|nr:unnamed protein product [Candida verbasci]